MLLFTLNLAPLAGVIALCSGYYENAPEEIPDSFSSEVIEAPAESATSSVSLFAGYLEENPDEPVEAYGAFITVAGQSPLGAMSGYAWGLSLAAGNGTTTFAEQSAALTVDFPDAEDEDERVEVYGSFIVQAGQPPAGAMSGYAWGTSFAAGNATFTFEDLSPAALTVEFDDRLEDEEPVELYGSFLTFAQQAPAGSMSGLAVGYSVAQGSLTGSGALSGRAVSVSTAAASTAAISALSGRSVGYSVAQGSLTGVGALSGQAVAFSVAAGNLTGASFAGSGRAIGYSFAAGNLTGTGALSGRAVSVSVAAANVGGERAVSGVAVSISTAAGNLTATAEISGRAVGFSTGAGNITGLAAISGRAVGYSVAQGSILGMSTGVLVGRAVGYSVGMCQATTLPTGTRINIYLDQPGRSVTVKGSRIVNVGPSGRHV